MKTSVLTAMRKSTKVMALLTLVSVLPMLSGCYGNFPLTKAVYKINGEITDNKFVHSVMLWVFNIIPVYGVAAFGDAIILNLIEFWTGEPVKLASQDNADGSKVTLMQGASQNEAKLMVTQADGKSQSVQFVRDANGVVQVRNPDGKLLGRVIHDASGSLLLQDADGKTIRTIPAGAVAHL